MLTDEKLDRLIAKFKQMTIELRQIAESDEDAAERKLAKRWLSTLHHSIDYAKQCRRDNAARKRQWRRLFRGTVRGQQPG
jgi:hypothetical protein